MMSFSGDEKYTQAKLHSTGFFKYGTIYKYVYNVRSIRVCRPK
jgi:hypothetical protein